MGDPGAANVARVVACRSSSLPALGPCPPPPRPRNTSRRSWPTPARDYRQDLLDRVRANKRLPNLIPRLKKDADEEYRAKRYSQAIDDLEKAISYGADDGLIWLRLAQAQLANDDEDHAMASAYNAYRKSTDPAERGNALFIIGRDYDRTTSSRRRWPPSRPGSPSPNRRRITERVEQLKVLVAFRVTKVEVEAEADAPRACLRFNEPIATKGDISYGDYVRTTPALDGIVTARGDTLCLDGLKHGDDLSGRAARRLSRRRPARRRSATSRPMSSSPTASRRSASPAPAMCCRARAAPGCR